MTPRVVLALGGGAAKGLAHVGVLRGLEEDGVEVAALAGTSMGSIVGALYARGMRAAEMTAFFAAVDWARLGWIMVRSAGGGAFRDLVSETIGPALIEELDLPFAAVCCDLATGDEVALSEGRLEEAVRASTAIPGILPPVVIGGRTLVDGAMVTPVPAAAAASLADAPLLAVNVLRPPAPDSTPKPAAERMLAAAAPAVLLARIDDLTTRYRRRFRNRRADLPSRLEVVMRSSHIMQYNLSRMCDGSMRAVLPEVGRFGWFDFHRAAEIMDEGYRAYRDESRRNRQLDADHSVPATKSQLTSSQKRSR
jgi:NTE family protein